MSISVDAIFDNTPALTDFANSVTANNIWQSFTSGSSEFLYGIQLFGKTPDTIISGQPISAVGVVLTVYNGTGTGGSVLASSLPTNVSPTTETWVQFLFPSPYATLVPGNVYTIAIGGTGFEDFLWGYSYVTPTSSYPGGQASFNPPSDLFFKVEVTPVPIDPIVPNTFPFTEVGNGTAANPAYTFVNDLSTGMFLQAPGQLGLSAGGIQSVAITSGAILPGNPTIDLGGALTGFENLYLNPAGQETYFQIYTLTDLPILFHTGLNTPVPANYTAQEGFVIRQGPIVFISGRLEWSFVFPAAVQPVVIRSTVSNTCDRNGLINLFCDNLTYPAGSSPFGRMNLNATSQPYDIELRYNTSGANANQMVGSMFNSPGRIFYCGSFGRPIV